MNYHGVIIGREYLYHAVYLSRTEYRDFSKYVKDIKGNGLGIHFLMFKGDTTKELLEYDLFLKNYTPIEDFNEFKKKIREVKDVLYSKL